MKNKTTAEIVDTMLKNFQRSDIVNVDNLVMDNIVISLDRFYEIETLLLKNNIIIKVDGYKWEITPIGKEVKRIGYEKWILKQEKIKDAPIWYNKWFIISILLTIGVTLFKDQILLIINDIIKKMAFILNLK